MAEQASRANVKQAVPFFMVSNMENSLRFYVDGPAFVMTHSWIHEGTVRWCWLQREGAGLMLQDFRRDDGYRVEFESDTDAPEETVFQDEANQR